MHTKKSLWSLVLVFSFLILSGQSQAEISPPSAFYSHFLLQKQRFTDFMRIFYRLSTDEPAPYNEWEALNNDQLFDDCYVRYLQLLEGDIKEWPFIAYRDLDPKKNTPLALRYLLKEVAYHQVFISWQSYEENNGKILEMTPTGLHQISSLIMTDVQTDLAKFEASELVELPGNNVPFDALPIKTTPIIIGLAQNSLDEYSSRLRGIINLLADFQSLMLFGHNGLEYETFRKEFLKEQFFGTLKINSPDSLSIADIIRVMARINLVFASYTPDGKVEVNFNIPRQVNCRTIKERKNALENIHAQTKVAGYSLGQHGYCHFEKRLLDAFHQQVIEAGIESPQKVLHTDFSMNLSGKTWRLIYGQDYLGIDVSFASEYDDAVEQLSKVNQVEHYLFFAEHANPQVHELRRTPDAPTTLREDIFARILRRSHEREIRLFKSLLVANKIANHEENLAIIAQIEEDFSKQAQIEKARARELELGLKKERAKQSKKSSQAAKSVTPKKKSNLWTRVKKVLDPVVKAEQDQEKKRLATEKKAENRRRHQENLAKGRERKEKAKKEHQLRLAPNKKKSPEKLSEDDEQVVDDQNPEASEHEKTQDQSIVEFKGTEIRPVDLESDWDIYRKLYPTGKKSKFSMITSAIEAVRKMKVVNGPSLATSLWKGSPVSRSIASFSVGGVNFDAVLRKLLHDQKMRQQELKISHEILCLNWKVIEDSDVEWKKYQILLSEFNYLAKNFRNLIKILRAESQISVEEWERGYNEICLQVEATEAWPTYMEFANRHLAWQNEQDSRAFDNLSQLLTDSEYKLDQRKVEQIALFQRVDPQLYMISQTELLSNLSIITHQTKTLQKCFEILQQKYDSLLVIYNEWCAKNSSVQ